MMQGGFGDSSVQQQRAYHLSATVAVLASMGNGYNVAALDIHQLQLQWGSSSSDLSLLTTSIIVGISGSAIICGWVAKRPPHSRSFPACDCDICAGL